MQVGLLPTSIVPTPLSIGLQLASKIILPALLHHSTYEDKTDYTMFAPSGTFVQAYRDVGLLPQAGPSTSVAPNGQSVAAPSTAQANPSLPDTAMQTSFNDVNANSLLSTNKMPLLIGGALILAALVLRRKK